MSTNTSAGRVFYGIQSDNYGISRPAVSESIDLRNLSRPGRGQALAGGESGLAGGPLAGLSEMTDKVIANAKKKQKPQGQQNNQQHPAEQSRQAHQQATLDSLTDQANRTAAEPAARMGVQHPDGRVSMATRDTRDIKTTADGPLGSFGEPAGSPFGVTPSPSTFGNGGFGV